MYPEIFNTEVDELDTPLTDPYFGRNRLPCVGQLVQKPQDGNPSRSTDESRQRVKPPEGQPSYRNGGIILDGYRSLVARFQPEDGIFRTGDFHSSLGRIS